jgi:hypothetical protein
MWNYGSAIEGKLKVVPILPKIVLFKTQFTKNYFLREFEYNKTASMIRSGLFWSKKHRPFSKWQINLLKHFFTIYF